MPKKQAPLKYKIFSTTLAKKSIWRNCLPTPAPRRNPARPDRLKVRQFDCPAFENFSASDQRKVKKLLTPLSQRQVFFVLHFVTHHIPGKAYEEAGYVLNSNRNALSQNAYMVLANPGIRAAVEFIDGVNIQRLNIDAQWVLEKLVALVDVSIDDFMQCPEDGGAPYFDITRASRAQRSAIETLNIETVELKTERFIDGKSEGQDVVYQTPTVRRVRISLSSKLKALELIGKHISVNAFSSEGGSANQPLLAPPQFTINPVISVAQLEADSTKSKKKRSKKRAANVTKA